MKTNWNRRIFSLVLCMALLLTGFPVAVYAQEAQPTGEITGSGDVENETPIEVDVAEAEDVPVDGSFTLTDDGEPVLEVTHQNELAVTGAFDGTMMNGFYTADFVMPDTGYNVFLTGLTKNNVARIKQAIIDNYVEGKLFEMKNLGFIDVEKTWYGDDDDLMCTHAAASNMLVGSGWAAQAGFTNSDDVFERYVDAFSNEGNGVGCVIPWFFTGYATYGNYDSPGFSGYLPQYGCTDLMEYYDFHKQTEAIYNRLRAGYTASISLDLFRFEDNEWFGGHAVTLWGFVTDPNYPADSKEHYKYIFVTDSDSNLAKKGKDRRTAPDVMSMIPIKSNGWNYWYSDPTVCDVQIVGATTLKPYNPDIPYETAPDATLDRANDPDAAIYDLILTNEPKDEERFDDLDHEEIISAPDYWSEVYKPYSASPSRNSKTELYNDATIYFCPYLTNRSNVDYTNQEDGISTRLTVTDAQGEVVFRKSYSIPPSAKDAEIKDKSCLFYSYKAQLPPGDYTATVEVNPNHTVPEAFYSNNTKSVDFKVHLAEIYCETSPDATLDRTKNPDVLIDSLILTDEPKEKERFDYLDNEEQVFDEHFWWWEYEPYYARVSNRSTPKTEFSSDATIYFCPYLINKADEDYINWDDGENIYTRLTVTDAQGEVVLQKSNNIPSARGKICIMDYSRTRDGVLFYSFKAQLPPGDYTATVEFNPNHSIPEAYYYNNTKSVDFKVIGPQLLGDTDGDGEITIFDVSLIQRVLARAKPSTDVIKKLGDVDQNDDLDVVDATLLQRWLIGLDQELTIGKKV